MKVLKKVISWPVVLTIQVVASVALLFLLFKLGVVPAKYMIILVVVYRKERFTARWSAPFFVIG